MSNVIVKTRDELEKAQKAKIDNIMIVGNLAEEVKKAKTVATAGKATIVTLTLVLGAALVTAPLTGGLSFAAAAPVAALTGLEIAAIISASAIGFTLIVAIFKDYKMIKAGVNENGPFIILERE